MLDQQIRQCRRVCRVVKYLTAASSPQQVLQQEAQKGRDMHGRQAGRGRRT